MVECPVCEFSLRGSQREGYRCVRCHSVFSQGHVRRMRQHTWREHIEAHFGSQEVLAEEESSVLEIAKEASSDATLDEYIGLESIADEKPQIGPRMPHEFFRKERRSY